MSVLEHSEWKGCYVMGMEGKVEGLVSSRWCNPKGRVALKIVLPLSTRA